MTLHQETAEARASMPRTGRISSRTLWAALDAYSLGGLSYLALKITLGDRFWPVALLNNLVGWLMLPALPLLALAVWRKRWARAAAMGGIAAAFVWMFGGLFVPRPAHKSGSAAPGARGALRLRVMAFNLQHDVSDIRRVLAEIRRHDADIVALEELTRDKAEAIAAELGEQYPYRVHYNDDIPGMGLISKYPITESGLIALHSSFLSHLYAALEVDGRRLNVYVMHTEPPSLPVRDGLSTYVTRASADIAEMVRLTHSGGPTLLVGDFNTADVADDYRRIAATGLGDTFREAGYGFGATWRARGPLPPFVRIDYIWHTREFTATKAWVGGRTGSDHLPVIGELLWRR